MRSKPFVLCGIYLLLTFQSYKFSSGLSSTIRRSETTQQYLPNNTIILHPKIWRYRCITIYYIITVTQNQYCSAIQTKGYFIVATLCGGSLLCHTFFLLHFPNQTFLELEPQSTIPKLL